MNVLRLGDHVRSEPVPVRGSASPRVLSGTVVELCAQGVRVDVAGFHHPVRLGYEQVQRA